MKKRILSFGVAATHESIASVGNFSDAMSLSDFDAFVLDPLALQGAISNETYSRRQNQIHDLIALKGGVVLCLLRPKAYIGFSQGGGDDAYGVFGLVAPNPLVQIRGSLRAGSGSHVELLPNARGASGGYLRVLAGAMRFAAYLDTASANLEAKCEDGEMNSPLQRMGRDSSRRRREAMGRRSSDEAVPRPHGLG
jgi:hypothetical protein